MSFPAREHRHCENIVSSTEYTIVISQPCFLSLVFVRIKVAIARKSSYGRNETIMLADASDDLKSN